MKVSQAVERCSALTMLSALATGVPSQNLGVNVAAQAPYFFFFFFAQFPGVLSVSGKSALVFA